MALPANLDGVSSPQVLDPHNISHDVMAYHAFSSVAIVALALLVFAAKCYSIKLNTDARNKKTDARNKKTASKERIARMQMETELEKTKMELTYRLLSSQLKPDPSSTFGCDPPFSSQLNPAAFRPPGSCSSTKSWPRYRVTTCRRI